jgi:hypothetical protein
MPPASSAAPMFATSHETTSEGSRRSRGASRVEPPSAPDSSRRAASELSGIPEIVDAPLMLSPVVGVRIDPTIAPR